MPEKLEIDPNQIEKSEAEKLRIIERANIIDEDDKACLALLMLGRRKAMFPDHGGPTYSANSPEEIPELRKRLQGDIKKLRDLAEELDLKIAVFPDEKDIKKLYEEATGQPMKNLNGQIIPYSFEVAADVFFAKTQDDLDAIVKARQSDNEPQTGLLLGYPKTAVEAFANGEDKLATQSEIEKAIENPELKAFIWFRLSKDRLKEELKEIDANRILIKENMPILYEQILTRSKKSQRGVKHSGR